MTADVADGTELPEKAGHEPENALRAVAFFCRIDVNRGIKMLWIA
jgi:hypothetical protein